MSKLTNRQARNVIASPPVRAYLAAGKVTKSMTATFETYKPTAFAFPALPDGLRWAGGWEDGEFTIEVRHGTHVVFLQRWDVDMCLAQRFPTNAEAVIARAAQRAGVYAAALAATRRYMPPEASDLWPLTPPPVSAEWR